jgi:hypothetical protein
MNEFYLIVDFLKELLQEDPLVNTTKHGLRSTTDIEKKNIFPLAHIQVINSSIQQGYISFTFEVTIVDIRNISKIPIIDKFYGNDNEIDNLNTTFAILNKLISKLKNLKNTDKIEMIDFTQPLPIIFEEKNLLDGWRTEIELAIPNNKVNAC